MPGGDYVNDLSLMLEQVKAVISSAREYVLLISDQPIVLGESVGSSFHLEDISVQLISKEIIDREVRSQTRSALPRSDFGHEERARCAGVQRVNRRGCASPA